MAAALPPAYTVGLVEATLRLLLLLLPPHAVLQGVYQPKREMISKLKTHSLVNLFYIDIYKFLTMKSSGKFYWLNF